MKAVAVYQQTREIRIIERKEPQIRRPNHVKLRVLEIGICGTDREISSFEYGIPPEDSDYLVIGHEALGEVIEVGSQVKKVRVAGLVVPAASIE